MGDVHKRADHSRRACDPQLDPTFTCRRTPQNISGNAYVAMLTIPRPVSKQTNRPYDTVNIESLTSVRIAGSGQTFFAGGAIDGDGERCQSYCRRTADGQATEPDFDGESARWPCESQAQ